MANLHFLHSAENVLFLGPSAIGKTHFSIALGYEAVKAGYKVLFITAQELTSQLSASLADATFQRELERLGKHLNLDKTASSHFFQVINQAYERHSPAIDPFKSGLDCSMMQ